MKQLSKETIFEAVENIEGVSARPTNAGKDIFIKGDNCPRGFYLKPRNYGFLLKANVNGTWKHKKITSITQLNNILSKIPSETPSETPVETPKVTETKPKAKPKTTETKTEEATEDTLYKKSYGKPVTDKQIKYLETFGVEINPAEYDRFGASYLLTQLIRARRDCQPVYN